MSKSGTIRAGMGGWTFEPWDTSFYPEKLSKAKQLQLCQPAGAEHRGQRHLLFELQGADLRQMGKRGAGRVRLCAEGQPLRHQSPRARRGRRIDDAFPWLRRCGTWRKARADPVAVRADQEIRSRRFRSLSETAAGKAGWRALRHAIEVRNDSFVVPEFAALAAQIQGGDRLCRPCQISCNRRCHRRFHLCAAADRQDDNPDCYTPKGSTNGQRAQGHGRRARCRPICRAPIPPPRRRCKPRDVFVYFITEGKVRAPFGAMALMKRVS